MSDENRPNLDSLFLAALEIQDRDERAAFVDRQCPDDTQLRAELEQLLASHDEAGSFLDHPAAAVDKTMDVNCDAMEAGLSRAFGAQAAVVIGDGGHSVLKSLESKISHVPRVVLRESGEDGAIERPASKQVPRRPTQDRYQLHGEIARGGMGAIIKGRDADLGRDLAIKVLLDSHKDKPEVIERFVEEAQIGGQLQHPGIVPVYELGQFSDERPFFSMKLVKGETLGMLLAARDVPNQDQAHLLGIFEQVCQTMAYAHSRGVIHRDLKPANIMVGAFGEVQVMDWGLAKVLGKGGVADELKSLEQQQELSVIQTRRRTGSDVARQHGSQTHMGSVMGTPAYMPPEQALGEIDRLDERADVFGLGAILCEILTGKPPYVGENATEVFRLASRGKLDDCLFRLDRCGADHELIELTRDCLAGEPQGRPRHAGELAIRVSAYLSGVQQRLRESELARAKAQTRRKLSVAIAALTLMIATGLAIAAGYFRQQHDVQAALARENEELADLERRNSEELERSRDELAQLNIELQTKNEQIKGTVLDQALAAALSGNEKKTHLFLDVAEDAGATPGQSELLLGVMEWQRNRDVTALKHIERAARLDKESVAARAMLALLYMRVGKAENLFTTRRETARLKPRNAEDYLFLALDLPFMDPDQAVLNVERSLDLRESPIARAIYGGTLPLKALADGKIEIAKQSLLELAEAQAVLGSEHAMVVTFKLLALVACISLAPDDPLRNAWETAADNCVTQLSDESVKAPFSMWNVANYFERIKRDIPEARRAYERMIELESGDVWLIPYLAFLFRHDGINATVQADRSRPERTFLRDRFVRDLLPYHRPSREHARATWVAVGERGYAVEALLVGNALGLDDEVRSFAEKWMLSAAESQQEMIGFVVGDGDSSSFLDSLVNIKNPDRRCIGYYQVALKFLGDRDRDRAKMFFQRVIDTGYYHAPVYHWAEGFLAEIARDPAFPGESGATE